MHYIKCSLKTLKGYLQPLYIFFKNYKVSVETIDAMNFNRYLPILQPISKLCLLFTSEVWRNKTILHRERENGLFCFEGLLYIFSQSLVNRTRITKKNRNVYFMGRCWATADHIEIVELLSFFPLEKSNFLLTSNLFVIKTEYFLNKFRCPFSYAIIGLEKLLYLVCNLEDKKIVEVSIFPP